MHFCIPLELSLVATTSNGAIRSSIPVNKLALVDHKAIARCDGETDRS